MNQVLKFLFPGKNYNTHTPQNTQTTQNLNITFRTYHVLKSDDDKVIVVSELDQENINKYLLSIENNPDLIKQVEKLNLNLSDYDAICFHNSFKNELIISKKERDLISDNKVICLKI